MLAVDLFQARPDLDLSWILYLLFGLFLLVIVIGAFTYGVKRPPYSRSGYETGKSSKKAIKPSSNKGLIKRKGSS